MPTPNDRLADQVGPASLISTPSPVKKTTPTAQGSTLVGASSIVPLLAGIGAVLVLLVLALLILARRKRSINQ
jgi:hypothetical protein